MSNHTTRLHGLANFRDIKTGTVIRRGENFDCPTRLVDQLVADGKATDDEAVIADTEPDAGRPGEPPRSGKGSGQKAWEDHAKKDLGLTVPTGSKAADIQNLVAEHHASQQD